MVQEQTKIHVSPAPTVWQLGFSASTRGLCFTDNPYEYLTQEFVDWYDGWYSAENIRPQLEPKED